MTYPKSHCNLEIQKEPRLDLYQDLMGAVTTTIGWAKCKGLTCTFRRLASFIIHNDKDASCPRWVAGWGKLGVAGILILFLGSTTVNPAAGVGTSWERACISILGHRDGGSSPSPEQAWAFLCLPPCPHPRAVCFLPFSAGTFAGFSWWFRRQRGI